MTRDVRRDVRHRPGRRRDGRLVEPAGPARGRPRPAAGSTRSSAELGVSRKVLTERLGHLIDHERAGAGCPTRTNPPRHEYELTARGRAFLPVLVAMQDWADRWLLGDGDLTATPATDGAEAPGCGAAGTPSRPASRWPAPAAAPPTRSRR